MIARRNSLEIGSPPSLTTVSTAWGSDRPACSAPATICSVWARPLLKALIRRFSLKDR